MDQQLDGIYQQHAGRGSRLTLRAWIDLATAWRIAQALRENGGNRSAAARSLGIGRRTLYSKMQRLGIKPSWEWEAEPPGFAAPARAAR